MSSALLFLVMVAVVVLRTCGAVHDGASSVVMLLEACAAVLLCVSHEVHLSQNRSCRSFLAAVILCASYVRPS